MLMVGAKSVKPQLLTISFDFSRIVKCFLSQTITTHLISIFIRTEDGPKSTNNIAHPIYWMALTTAMAW